MFNKSIIKKIPSVVETLEKEYFPEDKKATSSMPIEYKKLSWHDLADHGVMSEEKDQNEDTTIITRNFMAYDKSHWRTQKFCISTDVYRQYMRYSRTDEVENEIADLELTLEVYQGQNVDINEINSLKDRLKFLKVEFNIK